MLLTLVVELQGDLGVQADAEVVVHHTLLHVAVSGWMNKKISNLKKSRTQWTQTCTREDGYSNSDEDGRRQRETALTGSRGQGR